MRVENGTHNDNTVMLSALNFSAEQNESLREYNHLQQAIEQILCRFDSRISQMTPWNSDWAGGTEGSDLRIAKEYGLDPRQINHAKGVASEVFPLERAVTPFSEYKLRLGIAIMIEEEIQPKTIEAVKSWVEKGGKLKVGGDVLVGLKRWETLVAKTQWADMLLANMADELATALASQSTIIGESDLPEHFTVGQRYNALGFQTKGMEFARLQGEGKDLTPLLTCSHVLHRQPLTLPPQSRLTLLVDGKQTKVDFTGFGKAPNGDITVNYLFGGEAVQCVVADPNAVSTQTEVGLRKADQGNPGHYGTVVPGELLSYLVEVGDILTTGMQMCVLESMKMEVKISVPQSLDGMQVKELPLKGRTAETQGDILSPGDLVLVAAKAEN